MSLSSSSSSSPTVAVEKATSDLLMNPDWTMNIDICDSINSNHWQTKDVMKVVKRRLQHRSPKVQLLSLTLIETMVKNCGDHVHIQIAERNILGEMIKIVKKKADMNVRDKILMLLDSWQEVFGGPGGKHPQYYWAYDELRRSGVEFPKRSLNAAPIFFTPPVSNPTLRIAQAGYGMPSNLSRRLDETMATEIEGLSLSSLDAMRNVMELLNDMLQAVTPGDSIAVKDEVIVDLVSRCRANQKKLMQMLTTTGDEELLGRGLELNDSLQILLAKHDAIASGSVLSTHSTASPQQPDSSAATQKSSEVRGSRLRDSSPPPKVNNSSSTASVARRQIEDDDEEEDDFAQLARRHSKSQPVPSQSFSTETVENLALVPTGDTVTSSTPAPSNTCTALALPDPPAPVKTSKEQDIIDLLSITLSTSSASPHTPLTPPALSQNTHQVHMSFSSSTHEYHHHHHSASQGQIPFNNYVVPWAQPGPQVQLQSQTQPRFQPQPQPQPQHFQPQPQPQQQFQPQPQPQQQFQPQRQPQTQQQIQPQPQPQQQFQSQPKPNSQQQFQPQPHSHPQFHPQYAQYSSGYPPPPWSGSLNANHQSNVSVSNMGYLRGKEPALSTSSSPARPLQHLNSLPLRGNNELAMCGGDSWATGGPRNSTPSFIPSYRLFEDLNVFGSTDPRLKVTNSSTSSSLAGSSGQSMVGGRK